MSDSDTVDPREPRLAAAFAAEPEVWTPDCLTPERIIALAERALPDSEAAPLLAHVALCARCRREYAETVELLELSADVRSLEARNAAPPEPAPPTPNTQHPPLWRRWLVRRPPAEERVVRSRSAGRGWASPGLGFALGAAAAGAALFFTTTTPAREERDRLAAALRERETAVALATKEGQALGQELAALKQDSRGQTTRLAREVERLTERVRSQGVLVARLAAVEATLRQMPLPTADWMLAGSDGRVRGAGSEAAPAPEITMVRPFRIATAETRPVLECRPVPGGTAYRAQLEVEGSDEAAPALRTLSATRWTPSAPLKPGTVYRWAVTAERGGALLQSPLVKFYVLSAAQVREVDEARRRYAGDPLTLGAVYARLGMLPEAEAHFRAALKKEPSAAPVARRWLNELEARRTLNMR